MARNGNTPVIVGVAQVTDLDTPPTEAGSPMDLMFRAATLAARDSRVGERLLRELDSIAVVRSFADTMPRFASPFGKVANPPWSLARLLSVNPPDLVYGSPGGESPQTLLSRACERIEQGEFQAALVVGGEALRTELAAKRAGVQLNWAQDAPCAAQEFGIVSPMYTEEEERHGMRSAIAMYAMIGQAFRAEAAQSVEQYRRTCADLFAHFSDVAHGNPLAARREVYSAEAIAAVSKSNPYVGFPYTKLMTANAYIDQAAALLVVAERKADELGIARDRRVYLHGTAAAHDPLCVSQRPRLARSTAMRLAAAGALAQAGKRLADVELLDIYSCFPSAVQVACQEVGIDANDQRPLTVTGGLCYFGGPGNNYVTHAIAEMVQRLRAKRGAFGLVMANGGLLTKHAAGVYSTEEPSASTSIDAFTSLQDEVDRIPPVTLVTRPQGDAIIETYTVLHDKTGPASGLVLGRLLEGGNRFVAQVPVDPQLLRRMELTECLGLSGNVSQMNGRNVFIPQFSA